MHKWKVEVFLGFHQTSRTNSENLLNLVKTSLMSFVLPFSCIRGQGYDGASNMSGNNNGLQAKVSSENYKALYLYCFEESTQFGCTGCTSEYS